MQVNLFYSFFKEIFSLILWPLSILYLLADYINKKSTTVYKQNGVKVISVGNISTGGTGKTPAVIYFAKILKGAGYNPCVLSRGYKSEGEKKGLLVSDGNSILTTAVQGGDEPLLIAEALLEYNIPVLTGSNRKANMILASEKFSCDTVILDDGAQHYKIKKNINIILLDALNPISNGRLLPAGKLRSLPYTLKKADILILTKTNLLPTKKLHVVKSKLGNYISGKTLYEASHKANSLYEKSITDFKHHKIFPLHFLVGKNVLAFCALARPQAFSELLVQLGCKNVKLKSYVDHYAFKEEDIEIIFQQKKENEILICTEKDWQKIKELNFTGSTFKMIFILQIEFFINEEDRLKEIFFKLLSERN